MGDFMLYGILNVPCEFNDPAGVSKLKLAARRVSKEVKRLRFMIDIGLGWDD